MGLFDNINNWLQSGWERLTGRPSQGIATSGQDPSFLNPDYDPANGAQSVLGGIFDRNPETTPILDWFKNLTGNVNETLFPGDYEQLPGTGQSDYFSVDPSGYTNDFWTNFLSPGLGTLNSQVMEQNTDPNAFMSAFLNSAPQLQGLVENSVSDLGQSLLGQATRTSDIALENLASNFANMGSLYSGGFEDRAARVASNVFADADTKFKGAQMDMFNNLYGGAMGGFGNAFGNQQNYALGLGGLGAGYTDPIYANPTFGATPSLMNNVMSFIPMLMSGGMGQ